MSVELYVYLPRASMLSPADWQRAMTAAGYPVTAVHDFDPDTHPGFLPCTFDGSPSGFEYYADPLTAAEASAAGAPAGCDRMVSLRTGSDMREFCRLGRGGVHVVRGGRWPGRGPARGQVVRRGGGGGMGG